jgi:hypothetical protein
LTRGGWAASGDPYRNYRKNHTRVTRLAKICTLGILLNPWVASVNHSKSGVDFAEFYAAATLWVQRADLAQTTAMSSE